MPVASVVAVVVVAAGTCFDAVVVVVVTAAAAVVVADEETPKWAVLSTLVPMTAAVGERRKDRRECRAAAGRKVHHRSSVVAVLVSVACLLLLVNDVRCRFSCKPHGHNNFIECVFVLSVCLSIDDGCDVVRWRRFITVIGFFKKRNEIFSFPEVRNNESAGPLNYLTLTPESQYARYCSLIDFDGLRRSLGSCKL